ncbi:recombination endonuclease viI [Caudoviricetes sp.]|nr:recombination endonuclease viI [Caudoviricetes sp.]UOF79108.1 recombination endonuclease viI [Caudoviricetes sp.]
MQWKHKLKKVYGLTVDQYEKMLKKSKGKCGICKREQRLVVDHCHKTGKVRGLICNVCNAYLGWIDKDKKMLDRLRKHLILK